VKIFKNKLNIFLIVGFTFINMLIIISVSKIVEDTYLEYQWGKFQSYYKELYTEDIITFEELLRGLNNSDVYAFASVPEFQMNNSNYLALKFVATNSAKLEKNDSLKIDGTVFSEEDIRQGSKKIIISENLKRYVEKKSGKEMFYIASLDEWFEVIGILENYELINHVIVPYKNINNIENKNYLMKISRNVETNDYNFYPYEESRIKTIISANILKNKENLVALFLGSVMAIAILSIFTILWVDKNKMMFKVFKMVGFSNVNLIIYVFKRLVFLGGISLLATYCISYFIPIIAYINTPYTGGFIVIICSLVLSVVSLVTSVIALRENLLYVDSKG
jgi:hypothetical protein